MNEGLSTGCEAIDDLLGGGLARGVVTQIYGPPAAGKTNLALSSAVEVAARGGSVLYVDTEGLSIARFEQFASAHAEVIDDDRSRDWETDSDDRTGENEGDGTDTGQGTNNGRNEGDGDAIDDLSSRIVISEALDFIEQEEAIRDAVELADQVELIVLDSATGHYRLERGDEKEGGETLRRVGWQVKQLLSYARKHDLAVLLTNQVYTDTESDRTRPLGGYVLAHLTGVIIRLERFRSGQRRATLEKHESKAAGETARFRITGAGLESVEDF